MGTVENRPTSEAETALPAAAVVAQTIRHHRLLEPGQRVLVAFSGGADSTALALVLVGLGYDVVLGHVDHAMRPGSADDANHCRSIARTLGLAIQVETVQVTTRSGLGAEAAARAARYPALEQMAKRCGAETIATGHTLDDDAETVLLRLGRGGYPLGIPPRRGCIVRPLIDLRRAQTAQACRAAGISPVLDPSNGDERIPRNRLRRRVLPGLGDQGVVALAQLSTRARLAKQQASQAVDDAWPALAQLFSDEVRLDRARLRALEPRVAAGVLRRALERAGLEPSQRLLEDLVAKVVPVTGARLDLPGGRQAWADAHWLVVGLPACTTTPLPPVTLGLPVPSAPVAAESDPAPPAATPSAPFSRPNGCTATFRTRETAEPPPAPPPPAPPAPAPPAPAQSALGQSALGQSVPGWTVLEGWGLEVSIDCVVPPLSLRTGPWEALLDADAVAAAGCLVLRSRIPGDRYRPLGAPGERKLQDILVDLKIPRAERDRVPVITAGGAIAWLGGYRVADAFRLTPASRAALRIRLTRSARR